MVGPEDVLDFWLNEAGESRWYVQDKALDDEITRRFESTWQAAHDRELTGWRIDARGTLAYLILTDQFPRNMFRGSGRAFATDDFALAAAKSAINMGWDMRIAEPERQFFYLPLMHSENLCDQDRCVRLMHVRMPENRDNSMLHARAHREVIRQFGRFPYRNDALGRESRADERAYIADGGYAMTLRQM